MRKIGLHKALVLVFCVIVAVSIVTLVPSTLNYMEFWVAISHLELNVRSFNWSRQTLGESGPISFNASLLLTQNSSYVGLKLHSVDVRIDYGDQFRYLFERRFWFSEKSFDPYSTLDLSLVNEVGSGVGDLVGLLEQGNPVQLYFSTSVNVYLLGQTTADRVYLDPVSYTLR